MERGDTSVSTLPAAGMPPLASAKAPSVSPRCPRVRGQPRTQRHFTPTCFARRRKLRRVVLAFAGSREPSDTSRRLASQDGGSFCRVVLAFAGSREPSDTSRRLASQDGGSFVALSSRSRAAATQRHFTPTCFARRRKLRRVVLAFAGSREPSDTSRRLASQDGGSFVALSSRSRAAANPATLHADLLRKTAETRRVVLAFAGSREPSDTSRRLASQDGGSRSRCPRVRGQPRTQRHFTPTCFARRRKLRRVVLAFAGSREPSDTSRRLASQDGGSFVAACSGCQSAALRVNGGRDAPPRQR